MDRRELIYEGKTSRGREFQIFGQPGRTSIYKPDGWTRSEDYPGHLVAVQKVGKATVRLIRPIRSDEEEWLAAERFFKAIAELMEAARQTKDTGRMC